MHGFAKVCVPLLYVLDAAHKRAHIHRRLLLGFELLIEKLCYKF